MRAKSGDHYLAMITFSTPLIWLVYMKLFRERERERFCDHSIGEGFFTKSARIITGKERG